MPKNGGKEYEEKDKESVSYKNFTSMASAKMPAEIVVDLLEDNTVFQGSVAAWKSANIAVSPSQIAKGELDEKGYYEAVIFSLLMAQTQNKSYTYDLTKKMTSEVNTVLGQVNNWVKQTDSIDTKIDIQNGKISGIPADDKEKIEEYIGGLYKTNHPVLADSVKIAGMVKKTFEVTDSIVDGVNMMTSYMQISQLSVEMKAVVNEMYRRCPSDKLLLRLALQDVTASMNSMLNGFTVASIKGFEDMTSEVVSVIIDDMWTEILSSNPYSKAFLNGAKLGIFISNALFSTDASIEKYEKMKFLVEIDGLIRTVVGVMSRNYQADRSEANARNYLAAIEMLYSANLLSCDLTSSFYKVMKESGAGTLQVLLGNKKYDEIILHVGNLKSYCESSREDFRTIIPLCELEGEYPDIYAALINARKEEGVVAVSGIAFQQDEITIGLSDVYKAFKNPVITPFNATNSNVTYTSSDTSILEVSGPIVMLTPHKVGTVTVTVTTEDGGFSDTITVHVIDGKTNGVDDFGSTGVVKTGQCGDNARYTLFEDGLLRIDGWGEMWGSDYWHSFTSSFNSTIKSIKIGNGITTIGDYAFYECSGLTNVTMPGSVTSIGRSAFSGCSGLTSMTIPESVTSIGGSAFSGCSSLTSMMIPESVTSIGGSAFNCCSGLTSVTIPKSVTSIGRSAFSDCSGLTSITIPESITSIEDSTFYKCSALTSVTIPESVTSIGWHAFEGCSGLTSITILGNVSSIGKGVFYFCYELTNVTISGSIEFEMSNLFCHSYKKIRNVKLLDGVTAIGDNVFHGCSELTSVTVPEGITKIGDYAFSGCSSLTSVPIQESVKSIGQGAFSCCNSLVSVTIPENVESIGAYAFDGCATLTDVKVMAGSIGNGAFSECEKLKNLEIGSKVTNINMYAFYGCTALENVKIENGVTSIGSTAFCNCTALTSVDIPDSV